MASVALEIGGRTYQIACATGQEAEVKRLGEQIADRLDQFSDEEVTRAGAARALVMVSLILAGELEQAKRGKPIAPAVSDIPSRKIELLQARIDKLARNLS